MKIVFMGTPEFAVPSLKRLIDKYEVVAVFTQPDRPKGRGKKLSMSEVKEVAIENSIRVFQPEKLKDDREAMEFLKSIAPDFIIVVAYGQILTKEVLDIPKFGCINLHASLLPKYRGAAPINWAVINGEKLSGNTTMYMDVGLDTGDMLLKSQYEINDFITAGELHDILMVDGAELLVNTIGGIKNGTIDKKKQNHEQSNYAPMLNKELGRIHWNKTSRQIHNLVRGLNPWPIAHTLYKGESMKIYASKILNEKTIKKPGTILDINKDGMKVATCDGVLLVEVIQFAGKKPLRVEEFIKGNSIEAGASLGI